MFTLDQVVPWGRTFDEYESMFSLSAADLTRRILGCGDGPASFNVEATAMGGQVVSVDPLYQFSSDEIRARIEITSSAVLQQCLENQSSFVWDSRIPDVETLGKIRHQAMNRFLDDYALGIKESRYMAAALPDLPIESDRFDLALCSHFLFLYSNHVSKEDHELMIMEMLRVSYEVRVFPLLALNGRRSPHLDWIIKRMTGNGLWVSIEDVSYEFQKGGNQMLVIKR